VLEAEMPTDNPSRPRIKEFTEFLAPFGYVPMAFEFDGALMVGPPDTFPLAHANIAFIHPARAHFGDLAMPR
jgi:hypothetical protein